MYDGRSFFKKNMIKKKLNIEIKKCLYNLYKLKDPLIQVQNTRKEFDGDLTINIFPYTKNSKQSPENTAKEIGDYLIENVEYLIDFNIVKGFLNLLVSDEFWIAQFIDIYNKENYGIISPSDTSELCVVEYSSPNTNKPLHLGHIRNILLGNSISNILEASGKRVKKVQIINDRGIHICKSMVAWLKFGNNETPQNTGIKGDHLVGKYYVEFNKCHELQKQKLLKNGMSEEESEMNTPIILEAKDMLKRWEEQDVDIINLWKKMNNWVYAGFDMTYEKLAVTFDKNYFESETYLLGKEIIEYGLEKNVFYRESDGSVWIDLSKEGLDKKILLRSDGTSVYMTQDLGSSLQRHKDFDFTKMIYTVGNEQDYHFTVLFLILKRLEFKWSNNCFHLSYGMIDLPSGKMKSREGTVVDADELISDMILKSQLITSQLGKLDSMSQSDLEDLHRIIGLGALKYYILKVDPKKRMLFDPKASIDFNRNTGPFIQYTYARIQSILRRYNLSSNTIQTPSLLELEKILIKKILNFPNTIQEAADNQSPSIIANYIYELVKSYNTFYQNIPILNNSDKKVQFFRICLSKKVSEVIYNAMKLLGIRVPIQM